jgi:ElaB/YqjD/DUF883 family membrane-anchored ribosome-binding protein
MTLEDAANSAIHQTMDQTRRSAEKASQALKDGYGAARQYVEERGLTFDPIDLTRREPWLAIAAAFAMGYLAARLIRRVS